MKKLLYLIIFFVVLWKITPIFSFLGLYVLIFIFADRDPEMKAEVQAHSKEMLQILEQYVSSALIIITPVYAVLFIAGIITLLSITFGLKMVIREWKQALIIKRQEGSQ